MGDDFVCSCEFECLGFVVELVLECAGLDFCCACFWIDLDVFY